MKKMGNQKFQPRYYEPIKVLDRIDKVVHKLDLPSSALIHPTIQVSQLKLARGQVNHFTPLPS